jgi:type IV secretion system protein VirB4
MTMQNWFKKAKPARAIVPISRFVSQTVFALKRHGSYGMLFALDGIDDEGLTDDALTDVITRLRGAWQGLPPDCRLYEYVRIRQGYDIPRQPFYPRSVTDSLVSDRIDFLRQNARFRRIELFWCLTIEPQATGRSTSPSAQSSQSTRSIAILEKTAEILVSQLSDLIGLKVPAKAEAASFFGYLLNLEDWALDQHLPSDHQIDAQIVNSSIEWHESHLRVGKQFVQIFSLTGNPAASHPNLFGALRNLDVHSILCARWTPATRRQVEKRISEIEGFTGLFRNKLLAFAANLRDPENLEKTAGARAADKGTDHLAEIIGSIDNDGHQFGKYALTVLLHSPSLADLTNAIPSAHRVLVEAQVPHIEETIGNLAAYYSLLPGNSAGDSSSNFCVRSFWLRDDHHARLGLIFAPAAGSLHSEDLGGEYLTVYETRDKTPYFLDPYVEGMRTTLILGAPRRGKSVNGNLIIAHEQKYAGFTYVFDIGGSFESTIRLYGGTIDHVGVDGPRINPFSLEPTDANLQFLFAFIRLLLCKGGASLSPEDEDVINQSVRRMYHVAPGVRRLKYMLLPPHLQRFLTKWIEGGVYANSFDNNEDSLRLGRIQCFDFESVTKEQEDLIEPMLFWILRQINTIIQDRSNLGVPKHILFDELWKQMKNRQLLEMVLNSLKTGGKHLAGATLLTQSADDLGDNADLIVNACSTFLFLPDPTFNRERYSKLFNLNDRELENLASLQPREALLKRAEYSKIIRLNLDPKSLWLFSTKPKDRVRRAREIELYGFDEAFKRQLIPQ